MNNNNKTEFLKQNLSSVTSKKLRKDIEGQKLRNIERQYSEELASIEAEIRFKTEELKELKNQISKFGHQISLVKICTKSEQNKINTHRVDLNNRKRSFDDIHDRVRQITELRKKELKHNHDQEQELLQQKEQQLAQKIEQLVWETSSTENSCGAIERECAVLKKRNNAIMLKMRRKLIETENIRKDLLKKKNVA